MAFPAPAAPMDTCLSLTSAMGRARTLEDLYQAALDALAQGLGVVRSAILLFDPDGVMRFKASRGLSPVLSKGRRGAHALETRHSRSPAHRRQRRRA